MARDGAHPESTLSVRCFRLPSRSVSATASPTPVMLVEVADPGAVLDARSADDTDEVLSECDMRVACSDGVGESRDGSRGLS